MPAKKPAMLITRAETLADQQARINSEIAMSPKTKLSTRPPARLKGHNIASEAWTRLLKLYKAIDGELANAFDESLLIDYCMVIEEEQELSNTFALMKDQINDMQKIADVLKRDSSLPKEHVRKFQNLIYGARDVLLKTDARRDGKRKLSHLLGQALYFTPRSRGGVPPPEKVTQLMDEMSKLLGE